MPMISDLKLINSSIPDAQFLYDPSLITLGIRCIQSDKLQCACNDSLSIGLEWLIVLLQESKSKMYYWLAHTSEGDMNAGRPKSGF